MNKEEFDHRLFMAVFPDGFVEAGPSVFTASYVPRGSWCLAKPRDLKVVRTDGAQSSWHLVSGLEFSEEV